MLKSVKVFCFLFLAFLSSSLFSLDFDIDRLTIAHNNLYVYDHNGMLKNIDCSQVNSQDLHLILCRAIEKDSSSLVGYLFDATKDSNSPFYNRININYQDNYGNTYLHLAIEYSAVESYDTMVEKGADTSLKNKRGCSSREWSRYIYGRPQKA